ncbi:MAG: hypothetical protein GXC94_07615 [Comamonadaceae bacterium]|nr:hypothetical protein [Comamonadaceae bacterium]
MSSRLLLMCALACGQALAQSSPSTMPATEPAAGPPDCTPGRAAPADPGGAKACEARMSAAMPDPDKMLAGSPPGAGARPGPLTRSQVVEELGRARLAGEMDFAAFELGLPASRRR